MAKIKVTLPEGSSLVQGKQVSFTAPCSSLDTEAIQIDGVDYTVFDAMGNAVTGKEGSWTAGALVTVVIDRDAQKAYIQNGIPRVETISGDIEQIGDIKVTLRKDLPDNWLLCDKSIVDMEQYPALYELRESEFESTMVSGWRSSGYLTGVVSNYYGFYSINGYYIMSWYNGSYYGISYSDDPNADISEWKSVKTGTYGYIGSNEDIKYVNGYYIICSSQYICYSKDLSSWTSKQIHTGGTYSSGDIFYKDGKYYFIVDRATGSSAYTYYLSVYTATELGGTWTENVIYSYYYGSSYGAKPRISRTMYDEETGYYWFAGNKNMLNSTSNNPVIWYSTDLLTWNTMTLQSASWGRLDTFEYYGVENGYHIAKMVNTSSTSGLYYATALFDNSWVKSSAKYNSTIKYFNGKYHSLYDSNTTGSTGTYWAVSDDLAFTDVSYTNINASRYVPYIPMAQRVIIKGGMLIILTSYPSSASHYPYFLYSRDPEADGWSEKQISSMMVSSNYRGLCMIENAPHLVIGARSYDSSTGYDSYPFVLCNSTRLPQIEIDNAYVYVKAAPNAGV